MVYNNSTMNLNSEINLFSDNRNKKPSGQFIFSGPNGITEQFTLRCVHCGFNWHVEPGSGRTRGWCFSCHGPVCGKEWCMKECVPLEVQLEIMGGNRELTKRYFDTHFVQEYLHINRPNDTEQYKNVNGVLLK